MSFRFLVSVCALAAALAAQTPDGKPAFEVASIKTVPSRGDFFGSPRGGPGTKDPTLFICERCNLVELVSQAFDIRVLRILNGDLHSDHVFSITARIPEGASAGQFRLMLQNLLAERLKLTVHRDKKEMQIYRLVVMKGGPKFKESVDGSPKPYTEPNIPPGAGITYARKWTMEHLAQHLEFQAKQPVFDATGLEGEYDFEAWWSPDTLDNPNAGPGMFAALQSQLGLKLEPGKGPVDVVVIDHAEKVPTGN